MKKLIFTILTFLITVGFSTAQDLSSFSSELYFLKRQYSELTRTDLTIDEFEDEAEEIHRDADDLVSEMKDYMDDNDIKDESFLSVYREAEDFESFTSQNNTCDCLSHLNKFISEFGGSRILLKEQDGIKICMAEIGKYRYYYAYSVLNYSYTIKIKTTRTDGWGSFEFGTSGEVEIFDILRNNESWKITQVEVIKSEIQGYGIVKCKNEFPRNN
jgi:hypothetical protein